MSRLWDDRDATSTIRGAMTYSIFDTGNLVVSFDRADEAQAAFERIVHENATAHDRLLLVAFDDDGNAVGDYAPGDRLPQAA